MKKLFSLMVLFFCIFTAFAQTSGKYQADSDIPSLNISKGDIVYISFSRDFGNIADAISFENMSNLTSFIAQSSGGMAGLRDGYNFAFYDIEGVPSLKNKYSIKIRYNKSEVRIYNCTFTKIRD